MIRVNKETHTYVLCTFIHKWNELHLTLLPNYRASPPFGWYSFPILQRVGSWVGLGGRLHTKKVHLQNEKVTHLSTNWARRRVTLLIRPTPLPLLHAATHNLLLLIPWTWLQHQHSEATASSSLSFTNRQSDKLCSTFRHTSKPNLFDTAYSTWLCLRH